MLQGWLYVFSANNQEGWWVGAGRQQHGPLYHCWLTCGMSFISPKKAALWASHGSDALSCRPHPNSNHFPTSLPTTLFQVPTDEIYPDTVRTSRDTTPAPNPLCSAGERPPPRPPPSYSPNCTRSPASTKGWPSAERGSWLQKQKGPRRQGTDGSPRGAPGSMGRKRRLKKAISTHTGGQCPY